MNKRVLFTLLLCLLGLLGTISSSHAQTDEHQQARHLVQMPISVTKATNIGIPAHDSTQVANVLNEANVKPNNFNLVFNLMPRMALEIKNFRAIGNFVRSQKEQGLSGRQLADAVLRELKKFGIRSSSTKQLLPTSKNFYEKQLQKSLSQMKKQSEKDQYGRDEPPEGELETKQGGRGRRRAPSGPTQQRRGQFPVAP